jgi:hypothetical protein
MTIIWMDTNLKKHLIDLPDSVDIKINGIRITDNEGEGLKISVDRAIVVKPISGNAILILGEE